jgi:hypothetical protein
MKREALLLIFVLAPVLFQHAPASPPLVSTALRAFQHASFGGLSARRLADGLSAWVSAKQS